MDDWFVQLGFKETTLLGGLIGALLSLKFVPGANIWQRGTNVAGGMLTAAYLAPLVTSYLSVPQKLEGGIAFLIGLFGMMIADAAVGQIQPAIAGIRKKLTGDQQ